MTRVVWRLHGACHVMYGGRKGGTRRGKALRQEGRGGGGGVLVWLLNGVLKRMPLELE